jgi:hypothetical protein
MAMFMDQDLFNKLVFTIALSNRMPGVSQIDRDSILEKALATYRKSFPSDSFEFEAKQATHNLLHWLDKNERDVEVAFLLLNALLAASKDWHPNGTRRSKRLFNGIWFTSPRTKPKDRVVQFTKDLALYFAALSTGRLTE